MVLILLPPSEGKAQRGRGRPVDLERLSFPELTGAREVLLDSLAATSARPDAVTRLTAPAGVAAEVARNVEIRDLAVLVFDLADQIQEMFRARRRDLDLEVTKALAGLARQEAEQVAGHGAE